MKKTPRRTRKLALDREAIRNLTPEALRTAAGGGAGDCFPTGTCTYLGCPNTLDMCYAA